MSLEKLSASAIEKRYDAAQARSMKMTHELIARGFGNVKFNDLRKLDDPVAKRYLKHHDEKLQPIIDEMARRRIYHGTLKPIRKNPMPKKRRTKKRRTAAQKAATRKLVALNKKKRGKKRTTKRRTKRRTKKRATRKSNPLTLWLVFKCGRNGITFLTLKKRKPEFTRDKSKAALFNNKSVAWGVAVNTPGTDYVGVASRDATVPQIKTMCDKYAKGK